MNTIFSNPISPKPSKAHHFPSPSLPKPPSNPHQMKKWSSHEDFLLEKYQKRYGNKWNKIANLIPNRTSSQCSQRYRRKFKPGKIRTPWTEEEDLMVMDLVKKNGKNWQKISCEMKKRTAKQIRERYMNILDRNINKFKWSEEEDNLLIKYYNLYGAKWVKISKFLPGRPENSVKNRFHSHLKKTFSEQKSEIFKTEKKTTSFVQNSNFEKTERHRINLENKEEEDKETYELKFYRKNSLEEEMLNMGGSMKSITSKENNEGFTINSLLPHDILKLKVKTASSSDLSLKIQKSCSSESDKKGITSKKFKDKSFKSLVN